MAIVEPELIPGMLIGAGAAFAPKLLPALGGAALTLDENSRAVNGLFKAKRTTATEAK